MNDPFKRLRGKKFLINEPHPHAGEIATFIDIVVSVGITGKPGIKMKGETCDFFVFDTSEMKALEE